MEKSILLIDDEESFLDSARLILWSAGYESIHVLSDANKVLEYIEKYNIDLVTLDLTMPTIDGRVVLDKIVSTFPEVTVIIVSGVMESSAIVECMNKGARDYLTKPIDDERLVTTINNAFDSIKIKKENREIKARFFEGKVANPSAFSHVITQSPIMRQIFAYLELVSSSPLPILLTGEMGVGKSLIAQAIKNLEGQTNPFIYINVGEMNEEEFSDTLFGHQKGTLVDNLSDKKGKIAEAENGILFLDEIGRLSQESQRKLLHLIQENGYYSRGSNQIKKSNVKIIAATNKDIENDFNFRKDLYYRLSIHAICVPNLNSRLEDIPLLVAHFINKFNREFTVKEIKKISLRLKQQVLSGEIMGNVRELESLIANISYAGITVLNLMEKNHIANQYSLKFENFPTMDEIKFKAIQQAIEYCNNNKTFAAKKMNISKQTLFNILAKNKS